jgi:hypothetical protein
MQRDKKYIFVASLAVLGVLTLFGSLSAQQPSNTDQAVKQAAFDRPASAATPGQSVQFGRRESHVGDQVEQKIALEMRLTLNMRRANDLIGKHQTTVRTSQRRIVTSTAVEGDRTMEVQVQYLEATKQVIGDQEPSGAASAAAASTSVNSPTVPESVQGNTYTCRREPGENGKLIVTDEAGNRPPAAELDIVSQQMDMVGRPNPLAQLLAGRTIATGETLELPTELAQQIFNLGEKFGEVTRFTLTLQKVQPEGGANSAVFLASVDAASSDASQMRLQVEGPLVVQIDTCRAARVSLVGPIGISETRGSYSTAYQVIGTGRLQMGITSTYRQSQR